MTNRKPLVLSIGQCDLDHGNIARLLEDRFGATVDRAHHASDALTAMCANRYDLALVNRIFDVDGDEGLQFIERLKNTEEVDDTPVMLVSNYADAQNAAVAFGAKPGFGKAALDDPKTTESLTAILSTTSEPVP